MSKQQLTIEHLSPYLPYMVQMYWEDFKGDKLPSYTLKPEHIRQVLEFQNKPILRPLSDLTKEIEHNGEKFVPLYYNAFKHSYQHLIDFQNNFAHYKSVKYGILQRLFEWHFDVFGLIDQNLAINKNDL